MRTTLRAILLMTAVAAWALYGRAMPARAGEAAPPSLDEQLLDRLGGDTLDELDRELFAPTDQQPAPQDRPNGDPQDPRSRLERELGAAALSGDENPVLDIARQMRLAEGRIAQSDSGLTTQGIQKQIVADLDELIDQARKACQGQCSGTGSCEGQPGQNQGKTGTGTSPATNGTQNANDIGSWKVDRQQLQTLIEHLWNVSLPEGQRRELLQSPFDEFLPEYERLIEQYFRRLSEEEDRP